MEVRVGFEPTTTRFAGASLRPLGYLTWKLAESGTFEVHTRKCNTVSSRFPRLRGSLSLKLAEGKGVEPSTVRSAWFSRPVAYLYALPSVKVPKEGIEPLARREVVYSHPQFTHLPYVLSAQRNESVRDRLRNFANMPRTKACFEA